MSESDTFSHALGLGQVQAVEARAAGKLLHRAHFVSCPDAKKFRKAK